MNFKPNFEANMFRKISVDTFIHKHKKLNPNVDTVELKKSLIHFRKLKSEGEKCSCGNPIWVVGSAIAGKACFTCITGEAYSDNDYEIK